MRKLSFAVLFTLPFALSAAPELKGNPEDLRGFLHPKDTIINISADAQETAYSDKATLNLVITTEEKKLSKSIQSNAELRKKIRQALIAKGLPADNINNSNFSSTSEYGWFGDEPDSYKVLNRIAVEINQGNQLQIIAEIADQYDEVNLSGTTFVHSEKEAYNEKVKRKALDKVLAKKAYYEQALGIKLTPVSFNESNVRFQATQGASLLDAAVMSEAPTSMAMSKPMSSPQQPVKSSFDEVKYHATISVQFNVQQP